jgi:putative heme-binding domain-containing protein
MRNAYDLAFNESGDLFTFDSDMEWDVGLPWYRPTRVCHLVSGAEFGWRHGNGKWPVWAADSLPGIEDLGLSSPTGVGFGYGAHFPRKYHDALYVADWAYGTIWAVHLTPDGASYSATSEPFARGKPLPVTDTAIGPDGALWFTTGGRRTQSGVYRITYEGPISDTESGPDRSPGAELRTRLEALHTPGADGAVEAAWGYLGHADRYIRFAARTAIEHQDPAIWQERALSEGDPLAAAHALIALARCGDPSLRPQILDTLDSLNLRDIDALQPVETLAILRAYELTFTRMGTPNENAALVERLEASYTPWHPSVTRELTKLLVHLGSEEVVAGALTIARSTEDVDLRLAILFTLRHAFTGWTLSLRRTWLELCAEAKAGSGGASYPGYLDGARTDVLAGMSEAERFVLGDLAAGKVPSPQATGEPAPFVRDWTREELVALASARGSSEELHDTGIAAFSKARCAECHRFERSGGAKGPDLTGARRRFSPADLVETIVAPSSTISDQYADEVFELADDEIIIGRLLIDSEGVYVIEAVVPEEAVVEVDAADVLYRSHHKTSRMPEDLLDVLSEDEVRALFTLLLGPVE